MPVIKGGDYSVLSNLEAPHKFVSSIVTFLYLWNKDHEYFTSNMCLTIPSIMSGGAKIFMILLLVIK